MDKIKKGISFLLQKIIKNRHIIYLAIPFFLLDLGIRIHGYRISYFPAYYPVPNIFTIVWLVLFIGIIVSLKSIIGKIIYWVLFAVFFVLYLTHNIYYTLTHFYFSFNLLKLTDEGGSYIWDTIINTPIIVYISALGILALAIFAFIKMPKKEKCNFKNILIILLIFIVLHTITPFLLGSANNGLKWNTFKNARNTYEDFSDINKSMKVSGLYEYTFRSFYITFIKPEEKISEEDKTFLDNIYNGDNKKVANKYTGMFKGKNVIFLQLEGMDNWLLTKKNTPNLYKLMKQSINFTDHYALYTGGGSTFNSEFAVNTGFTTPLSYIENVYSFNKNTFTYSMPNLFKDLGYHVNAFHMNTSDFYSRGINYKSWGYDKYWGLKDFAKYKNKEETLDRYLIENKTMYKNMFQLGGNFVDYIITYSPHTPFTTTKGVGEILSKEKYKGLTIPNLSEEDCVKLAAGETDRMVGLLIQALKDNNLYDNTVIVAYADHYLYTVEDKTILDKNKNTFGNMINKTPFFIWSNGTKPEDIKKTNMQTDILPTVLNMFGINYNSNNYVGNDIMSKSDGYVFFPDYSWWNGKYYSDDGKMYTSKGKVIKSSKINQKEVSQVSSTISNAIRQNDLTLRYNYFANK